MFFILFISLNTSNHPTEITARLKDTNNCHSPSGANLKIVPIGVYINIISIKNIAISDIIMTWSLKICFTYPAINLVFEILTSTRSKSAIISIESPIVRATPAPIPEFKANR